MKILPQRLASMGQALQESSDEEYEMARENTTDEEDGGYLRGEEPTNYQGGDTMQEHVLSSLAMQERGHQMDKKLAKEACWHQLVGKCTKREMLIFP